MTTLFERLRTFGAGWKGLLSRRYQLYPDDEPMAPNFRAKQLQVVLRMTPLNMVVNLLNALLVGVTFWDSANRWLLSAWMLLIIFFAWQGLRSWYRYPALTLVSRRALRRAAWRASLLAFMWGGLIVALFATATRSQQLLLATLMTGLMSAGAFSLATVPVAGTAWVSILTAASFIAITNSDFPLAMPVGSLLFLYGFIVSSSVWTAARTFGSRLLAEAKTEQQNQVIGLLLRDFEENASDVLWETDARGYLTHISKRLEEAFGLSSATLTRNPLIALLTAAQNQNSTKDSKYLAELSRRLAKGEPFRDQLLPIATPQQKNWWSLSAKPLHNIRGEPSGWRGVASNVTERILAQQAQRTQHERLEELVQERTAKLNQALHAAESANRAKSLFLSSMSHELRTPLNAVLGYAQLLQMNTDASPETRESASEIETAGRHLLALVNDVLDLARIESGKLELSLDNVLLSEVLAESRRSFAPQAQAQHITLDIPELPALLRADPVRLRQVLFNLISNAIKYNRDGGRVSVHGEARPGLRYRITVRDTGPGIPADRLGELFQPFNRIGAERSTVEGTGIGLVITKTLVEAMAGSIGVESSPGEGSAFWFELPLASGSPQGA